MDCLGSILKEWCLRKNLMTSLARWRRLLLSCARKIGEGQSFYGVESGRNAQDYKNLNTCKRGSENSMKKEGIGITAIIVILIVVVVAVTAGSYVVLSGGLTREEVIDVEDVSSLKFEFGEIKKENVEPTGTVKMMDMDDEQNLKIRADIHLDDEEQKGPSKLILNKELEKAWAYLEEVPSEENLEAGWFIVPDEEYSNFESGLTEMRDDVLEGIPQNWTGGEFTIENERIRIYDIEVNPPLDVELFVVEDYEEIPESQY